MLKITNTVTEENVYAMYRMRQRKRRL